MENTTLSEQYDLAEVVRGLTQDLRDHRLGKLTDQQARVRHDLAKQVFNGLRLVISAQRFIDQTLKKIPPSIERGT